MNKLESMLRKAGGDLANQQVARWWKMPEAMQKTPCDFMGFDRYGRVILIEAKMVSRERLSISSSPGLRPHQWLALQEAHNAGGFSLILWAKETNVAIMSWVYFNRVRGSLKSIHWDDIHPLRVCPFGDQFYDDFLGALKYRLTTHD